LITPDPLDCKYFDTYNYHCRFHGPPSRPTCDQCDGYEPKNGSPVIPKKREKIPDQKEASETADPDPGIDKDAMKILREGRPIDYIIDVWHRDYVGGEWYGRMLIFSALCGTCNNTMGLHPACDGRSWIGKSYAMQAMSNLIHPDYVIIGTISPKALFYNEIKPGCVVFLDDIGNMPDDLAQVIKIASSQYQQGTYHRTVNNKTGDTKYLQKCLEWWINGVDANSFDIQILNRNVNISLDETNKKIKENHDRAIFDHQLKDAMIGRPAFEMTREVQICREIAGHLLSEPQVNVSIPWL
jgi:hypothetical protein